LNAQSIPFRRKNELLKSHELVLLKLNQQKLDAANLIKNRCFYCKTPKTNVDKLLSFLIPLYITISLFLWLEYSLVSQRRHLLHEINEEHFKSHARSAPLESTPGPGEYTKFPTKKYIHYLFIDFGYASFDICI
jgi:hypothetical protein